DGPALQAQMSRPSHAAYDSNSGDLLILDSKNHCIRKLSPAGMVSEYLGTCGTSGNSGTDVDASSLLLNQPTSIALDASGNLIIADRMNHKVRYYNRGASAVTIGPINIGAGRVMTIACLNGTSGSNTENILSQSA